MDVSALAVCVMVLAFALLSPYSLIHYPAALRELVGVREFLYGDGTARAFWVHLQVTLPQGFGWLFYLAGVVGMVRAAWLRRPTDLVLLAFLVPFFALVSSVSTVFPRYLVPLVPLFAVLAAELGVSLFFSSFSRENSRHHGGRDRYGGSGAMEIDPIRSVGGPERYARFGLGVGFPKPAPRAPRSWSAGVTVPP